ncbi:4-diphosphocytidyl-2-C-methyl-D-erythritol kinase [Algimonas arctica]|uniref:4-diphosphocytidyl-2-C-methyl-D-erythritol kinase n=1 Tax=Algimonas arctica TaxID=1479486 RepID=A0A8J3G115_9PROT|nr:4-(cytidine 5'-diphospho)-2-C-methyl-D-erythritol kinase [Algimonas arctica]GHA82277.1 4-diphosphocytidyl-2-C-methyl-D-erythritol kinase [Algimonas arctica]
MLCRAKVNLTLHVGAPIVSGRWSGYHPVESLVVFANFGDDIVFAPDSESSLTICGPFGAGLTAGPDNLITKALRACDAPPQSVRLTKRLPVSSGLGGGSTNAAAVLRVFDPGQRVDDVSLGADIPVCRLSKTSLMEGIGEVVSAVPHLGSMSAVLVNPGVPVNTGDIFRAYDSTHPPVVPHKTARQGSLLERALSGTNDLEAPAIAAAPVIGAVLTILRAQPECNLARMSGSGGTCFGLFSSDDAATRAADVLSQRGWWAVATRLGEPS